MKKFYFIFLDAMIDLFQIKEKKRLARSTSKRAGIC